MMGPGDAVQSVLTNHWTFPPEIFTCQKANQSIPATQRQIWFFSFLEVSAKFTDFPAGILFSV